jgi:hypothetical protein
MTEPKKHHAKKSTHTDQLSALNPNAHYTHSFGEEEQIDDALLAPLGEGQGEGDDESIQWTKDRIKARHRRRFGRG